MPYAPPRHNAKLVEANKRAHAKQYNKNRENQDFYGSKEWGKVRALYRKINPLCVECKKGGRAILANVVDHIIPVKDGGARLSFDNLQSLCHLHHNRKTKKENTQRLLEQEL